jgi:GTPase SAR1 family protein
VLSRKEIEQQLTGVEPKLCAVFAIRCALRVLPLFVSQKEVSFGYWQDNQKAKHLLSVLVAQQTVIHFLQGDGFNAASYDAYSGAYSAHAHAASAYAASVTDADAASADYASAAYASAASAISASVSAVTTSVSATSATTYAVPAAAAAASAYAAAAHAAYVSAEFTDLPAVNRATKFDLNNISSGGVGPDCSVSDILESSLWDESPLEWLALKKCFYDAVRQLDDGFDVWLDWYQDRVEGKRIDADLEHKWANIPEEVKAQGVSAINAYLASLVSHTLKKPLNLVRGIFIGNGAAGKTSLIRALHNEAVVEGKEEMTPGIAIREWAVPETDIKARLWDFGGQVMSHSTHQFFLRERCLYILVLDARSEFNANDQAEYWLEHVKAFGKNASVMLVGNKSDLTEVNLDMNALKEKYPNIVGFYSLSCTDQTPKFTQRFAAFQTELVEHLQAIGTHQVYFTDEQFNVLKTVREQSPKQAFLSHEKFDQLCNANNIGQEGLSKQAFLGLLDSLGEVIHFPDLARLDEYVLNPRWLTYGVYTLLYAEITTEQKGQLCERDVIDILQNEKVKDEHGNVLDYPSSKCGFIIDAMTEFKLCYRLPSDSKRIVIPDKLPSEQPDIGVRFDVSKQATIAFEFVFEGFLPRHVMPSLIVTRNAEVVDELVWQNGVVLKSERHQALARVQVDYHDRILRLWIQGAGRREYLEVLTDEVNTILSRMEKLEYREMVVLPKIALPTGMLSLFKDEASAEKAPYKRLISEAKRGQVVTTSDSGKEYDLRKVMGLIMSEQKQGDVGMNVTVNGNVGAIGGSGDHQQVTGTVIVNEGDKAALADYLSHIEVLMKYIESYDADFKVKMDAYNELRDIRETLESLETSTPESRGKLGQLLGSIKDGSLGALKLGTDIKDAQETVTFLMTNAAAVSTSLSGMGIIG